MFGFGSLVFDMFTTLDAGPKHVGEFEYAEGVPEFQPGVAATPGKRAVDELNAEGVRERQLLFKPSRTLSAFGLVTVLFPGVATTPG